LADNFACKPIAPMKLQSSLGTNLLKFYYSVAGSSRYGEKLFHSRILCENRIFISEFVYIGKRGRQVISTENCQTLLLYCQINPKYAKLLPYRYLQITITGMGTRSGISGMAAARPITNLPYQ